MSKPSRSSSSLTRRPTVKSTSLNATTDTTADQTTVVSTALAGTQTCEGKGIYITAIQTPNVKITGL